MAYKPQYYPGNTSVAKNRRKHMADDLEKLRDISEEQKEPIQKYKEEKIWLINHSIILAIHLLLRIEENIWQMTSRNCAISQKSRRNQFKNIRRKKYGL